MSKLFIVTLKFPKDPQHNPQRKLKNYCRLTGECTDSTGEHHSMLERAESAQAIRERLAAINVHVTRIERVDYIVNSADEEPQPKETIKGVELQVRDGDFKEVR